MLNVSSVKEKGEDIMKVYEVITNDDYCISIFYEWWANNFQLVTLWQDYRYIICTSFESICTLKYSQVSDKTERFDAVYLITNFIQVFFWKRRIC